MQHFFPSDSINNARNFSFSLPLLAHSKQRKPSQLLLIEPEQYFQPFIAEGDNSNEKSKDFKEICLKNKVLKVEEIKLEIVEEKPNEPIKPCE